MYEFIQIIIVIQSRIQYLSGKQFLFQLKEDQTSDEICAINLIFDDVYT